MDFDNPKVYQQYFEIVEREFWKDSLTKKIPTDVSRYLWDQKNPTNLGGQLSVEELWHVK